MYYGQHRNFVKEGWGKICYFNGSHYEGGWLNNAKNKRGRMFDNTCGDIYNGEYLDGKISGRGRMYYAALQEIYDGDWASDRRQGEGYIINRKGEICSGDFRAGHMEGKLTYVRTLNKQEVDKLFKQFVESNDMFIFVTKGNHSLDLGEQSKAELSAKTFKRQAKMLK